VQANSDDIRDGHCGISRRGGNQGACDQPVPTANIYANPLGAWHGCVRWDDPVLSKYSNCLKSLAESDWARLDRSKLTAAMLQSSYFSSA
jgi:hypothetical protein